MMKPIVAILFFLPGIAAADEALIAVATNFQPILERLRDDFEAASAHEVELSGGSTGVLYAQIVNGAPYDVFLAADQHRPRLLEQSGSGVAGSRFTYAEGRLAFWSRDAELVQGDLRDSIASPGIRVLAIANPDLAPYGHAAREAIRSAGMWDDLNAKLVLGENVGQAFSMIATGNADAGVVAMSTVLLAPGWLEGHFVEVPGDQHTPILQDAILLQHGADNQAALDFLEYLQSHAARDKIASFGYRE